MKVYEGKHCEVSRNVGEVPEYTIENIEHIEVGSRDLTRGSFYEVFYRLGFTGVQMSHSFCKGRNRKGTR